MLSSLFCDNSNAIRFCQVFMTFSSFFGRKSCKTQDVHDQLPQPRFPCGRPSRGATRSCRQHLPKSCLDTPVKNNKNPRFVISFLLFYFISSHFSSFHCVLFIDSFLPSFIHSFIHTFHGCACQASLSAGVRSSVNAVPQRHFGPPDVLMIFYFIFLCFKKKCTFVFLTYNIFLYFETSNVYFCTLELYFCSSEVLRKYPFVL